MGAISDIYCLGGIRISMDCKDLWADDVFVEGLWRRFKYEEIYLERFTTVAEAHKILPGLGVHSVFQWKLLA